MKKKLENSPAYGEVRALDEGPEGIVEGYLTKWGTVDSWNTSFQKGAFTKTFSKRGAKGTRLIWNHRELAGKILELKEDSYGPFVKAQFNMDTTVGKEAYAHVRAGDINCFSFGFNTVKDQWKGQIREILEVDMLECGPVVFEANDKAKVTDVRESRSIDFDETQAKRDLREKGWKLLASLRETIDDIFYQPNRPTPAEITSQVDTAIAKFHLAYIEWLKEYYAQFETREGNPPSEGRNSLQRLVSTLDTGALVRDSTLTSEEVTSLKKGMLLPLEARARLEQANGVLFKAHQGLRSNLLETLCDEIRSTTLTEGEIERVEVLIENNKKPSGVGEVIDFLQHFRAKL